MRRAFIVLIVFFFAFPRQQQATDDQTDLKIDEIYGASRTTNNPKLFFAGNEYIFHYNSQIAFGLAPSDTSERDSYGQKAMGRMLAQVMIQFLSDHNATLQLQKIKVLKIWQS